MNTYLHGIWVHRNCSIRTIEPLWEPESATRACPEARFELRQASLQFVINELEQIWSGESLIVVLDAYRCKTSITRQVAYTRGLYAVLQNTNRQPFLVDPVKEFNNISARCRLSTYSYARSGWRLDDHRLQGRLEVLTKLQGCLREMGNRCPIYAEQVVGGCLIFGLNAR